jgi:hypothetical protein
VTGDKPIAVSLQSISVVRAVNSLVAFYDIYEKAKGNSFVLSQAPNETSRRETR